MAKLIVKTRILTWSLVIFLLSILSLGIISSSSHAYAQQHALELKATQQGAEVEEESGAEE